MRGRLFLLIAALVGPALAIIAALSWEAYRSQQDAIRSELANTARAVAGLVDSEIARSVTMLRTLAASRAMQEQDWAGLDQVARRVLPDERRWLVVLDLDGRQLVNTRQPRGEPIPDVTLAPDYLATMRAGRVYVSKLVFGPVANGLIVHVGLPIGPEGGEVRGVSLVMTPETLGESLDVRRFAADGVLSILDPDGRIIVRNRSQQDFVGRSATADLVRATQAATEGMGESVTLEGIPVFIAFARAKCGWTVALGTPKANVLASARRIFLLGLGSAGLVTLAALGIALWIGRAVVRGVDGLARDAERLARGEAPAAATSHLQEIQTVAQAMRRMAATKNETELQLREARDRLQQHAQELERRVEERTASLREAVTQMEEFSYTVSHDLRGPLRSISGFASILMEENEAKLDETSRDYLRRIVRASERLNRLTTDILAYSRVARADVERHRVSLEPLLRGAMDQYAELNPRVADVMLVLPLEDVVAHESSLAQALTNLLTNAAKFVRPGERPRITVRTERRGARVRVWVEDRGIGIPPAQQERLFRIFERTPAASGYEGTGVGLAIVRRIVEKTGGTCGLESDGETGSRFWLELEAAEEKPGRGGATPAPAQPG